MGKRRYNEEDTGIEEKLRRLKRRLKKYKRLHRQRYRSSSSDSSSRTSYDSRSRLKRSRRERSRSNERSRSSSRSERSDVEEGNQSDTQPVRNENLTTAVNQKMIASLPLNQTDTVATVQYDENTPQKEGGGAVQEPPVDDAILEILGKRLNPKNPTGPPIDQEIVLRWSEIAKQGLEKDDREKLFKEYATPENCKDINAPVLNPEVKISLPKGAIERDERIVIKQTKITVALSAIGRGLSAIIKDTDRSPGKLQIIRQFGDAARLLVDVQLDESQTRRALVVANLNPDVKETLNATPIGEKLFDTELEGQIKVSKALDRTSKELMKKENSAKISKNEGGLICAVGWKPQTRSSGQKKKSWNNRVNSYQRFRTRTSSSTRRRRQGSSRHY